MEERTSEQFNIDYSVPQAVLVMRFPWFTQHTGYAKLADTLKNRDHKVVVIDEHPRSLYQRGIDKLARALSCVSGELFKEEDYLSGAEKQFLFKLSMSGPMNNLGHILNLECHPRLMTKLSKIKERTFRMVGALHLPYWRNTPHDLEKLNVLDAVIVLYESELPAFSVHLSQPKIYFIPHGVDTEFFSPDHNQEINKLKLLCVGYHLRDFPMLGEVFRILKQKPGLKGLELHLVNKWPKLVLPLISPDGVQDGVYVHPDLSDSELLFHYRNSNVLVLPLQNAAASNTVVESMSCGLPIVTTDGGGISSYGGGDLYPLCPQGDVGAMVSLTESFIEDAEKRAELSQALRRFAATHLSWERVCEQHTEVYRSILEQNG